MAAVLAPNPTTLRRRTFRDGTILLANRAVDLINLPAARNVARELRALAVALKPRILQAPGVNDENAREQTNNLELYAEWIETIAERMSPHGVDLDGTAEFWGLVREFDEYLSNAVQELQEPQRQSTTVKLACQNEITRRLEAKKENTLNHVISFCFKICLLACCVATQTQADVKQLMELVDVRLQAERLSGDERTKRLVERETYSHRTPLRSVGVHSRRDGTLLLANQAANLVNVPATRNTAHGVRAFVTSLRVSFVAVLQLRRYQADANQPRILQAPGENDQNAREQVANIQHHAQLIAAIPEVTRQLERVESNGSATDFLALLDQFNEPYLLSADTELQDLRQQALIVRFACQTEITRLLEVKKEETLNRVVAFCVENGLLANYASAQTRADLGRFMELVNRRFENERLSNDERLRQLVALHVNAMLRAQDVQEYCQIWLAYSTTFFFFFFENMKIPMSINVEQHRT
ncbi:hypothetical protein FRC12_004549 [Ceratobasidium sp. 428]|nr:hypothetical protein FRC12_004549 [Ceratobasidium sp. 428]